MLSKRYNRNNCTIFALLNWNKTALKGKGCKDIGFLISALSASSSHLFNTLLRPLDAHWNLHFLLSEHLLQILVTCQFQAVPRLNTCCQHVLSPSQHTNALLTKGIVFGIRRVKENLKNWPSLESPCHLSKVLEHSGIIKTFVCYKTYPAANVRWSARDIATGLQHLHQFKIKRLPSQCVNKKHLSKVHTSYHNESKPNMPLQSNSLSRVFRTTDSPSFSIQPLLPHFWDTGIWIKIGSF